MRQGCIAKSLVVNEDGKILILTIGEHTKYPELSYLPDLPGGIVESGEDPLVGALRELSEEAGIVVSVDQVREAYRQVDMFDQQRYELTRVLYVVFVQQPIITLSYEHQSYKWTMPDEVWDTRFQNMYFDNFIDTAFARVRDDGLLYR